ncbi:hypothetical protein [Polaromonas sp.]|uniref:hypothetical protein n=1 Tax=Polaromonas sp. TaxID=1869339 RepID=UPI0025F228E1|nr:hypothetical protein [Polaromonas sp.]
MLEIPARLFVRACCRVQVLVCSYCDHGQIYCADGWALQRQRELQMQASKRYQCGFTGRLKQAARNKLWRARQAAKNEIVTHQGSQEYGLNAVLDVSISTVLQSSTEPCIASTPTISTALPCARGVWSCHWCGSKCLAHVRLGFLRHLSKFSHGHNL